MVFLLRLCEVFHGVAGPISATVRTAGVLVEEVVSTSRWKRQVPWIELDNLGKPDSALASCLPFATYLFDIPSDIV